MRNALTGEQLIASSKTMHKLPSSLGQRNPLTWIPVDLLARIVLELVDHAMRPSLAGSAPAPATHNDQWTKYFHVLHPSPSSWDTYIPTILHHIGADVDVVPIETWVQAVRESKAEAEDQGEEEGEVADRVPGVKLLDFYEGLANGEGMADVEVKETVGGSRTMREMEGVGRELMGKWLEEWGF